MESLNRPRIARQVKSSVLDQIAKKIVFNQLKNITVGRLIVEDEGEITCFGDSDSNLNPEHHAHIYVHKASAYRGFMLAGSIGAAEGYMAGSWSSPNLTALIQLCVPTSSYSTRLTVHALG